MNFANLFRIAFRALGNNKMRGFLTMLGIIIGVASVITMLAIGQGSKRSIRAQIEEMGSNMIMIHPGADRRGGVRLDPSEMETLKQEDYNSIVNETRYVAACSPSVSSSGQAIYGANNYPTTIYGINEDYMEIRRYNVAEGEMFSEDDIYELITDNLDDILKAANVSLDDGQKEKFLREIKKQLPDIVEVVPTSESLVNSEHNFEINLIQELFSTKTKVILCVCLVISGVIVVILKRKDFEWCANLGVALLISGLVILGIGLLVPEFLVDMIGTTDISLFASSIVDSLAKPIMYSGVGVLVLAILLFIFYKVMENRNYKKSKS